MVRGSSSPLRSGRTVVFATRVCCDNEVNENTSPGSCCVSVLHTCSNMVQGAPDTGPVPWSCVGMNTPDWGLNLTPSHPRRLQWRRGSGACGSDEPQGVVPGLHLCRGAGLPPVTGACTGVRCEETVLVVGGVQATEKEGQLPPGKGGGLLRDRLVGPGTLGRYVSRVDLEPCLPSEVEFSINKIKGWEGRQGNCKINRQLT